MDQHYTGVMIDPGSSCVCLSGYAYAILECYLHNGYHLVCDKIYLLEFALFSKFNESMLPAYFSSKWKNNMERNITEIYEITWCWYGFQPVRPHICLWFVFQPAGICLIGILVWFWFPASWKFLSGLPTSTAPPSSSWKSNSPPTRSKICLAETFWCQQKNSFWDIQKQPHFLFCIFKDFPLRSTIVKM